MYHHSLIETPIGSLLVVGDEEALVAVVFEDQFCKHIQMPPSLPGRPLSICRFEKELKSYFEGDLEKWTTPYYTESSSFRTQVWKDLTQIPFGKTCTYQEVATRIENPKAVRAVGTAIGRNPLSLLIPCHRVIGKRDLGGYAGGLYRKEWLLRHEGSCKKR